MVPLHRKLQHAKPRPRPRSPGQRAAHRCKHELTTQRPETAAQNDMNRMRSRVRLARSMPNQGPPHARLPLRTLGAHLAHARQRQNQLLRPLLPPNTLGNHDPKTTRYCAVSDLRPTIT
jgi:hypothetical protein